MTDLDRVVDNDRGLGRYGEPIRCLYGSVIQVRDSSSADDVCCWLKVDATSWWDPKPFQGEAANVAAHLNVDGAKAVIARLQAFVDSVEGKA